MIETSKPIHYTGIPLGAGWLSRPTVPDSGIINVGKYAINCNLWPTRAAEYQFVLDAVAPLPPSLVYDLGAGFNPQIHVLPHLLEDAGHYVVAIDKDMKSLDMPVAMRIIRVVVDMVRLPMFWGTDAELVVSISTLEHLGGVDEQLAVVESAYRLLGKGGHFIATADLMSPDRLNKILQFGGFEVGPVRPFAGTHLTPRVSAAIGRKP